MEKINITCDTCFKTHEVGRTKEIPNHVKSMGCNWCPCCEDRAEGYYEEWYNEDDNDGRNGSNDVPDNQLVMPFIIDFEEAKKKKLFKYIIENTKSF